MPRRRNVTVRRAVRLVDRPQRKRKEPEDGQQDLPLPLSLRTTRDGKFVLCPDVIRDLKNDWNGRQARIAAGESVPRNWCGRPPWVNDGVAAFHWDMFCKKDHKDVCAYNFSTLFQCKFCRVDLSVTVMRWLDRLPRHVRRRERYKCMEMAVLSLHHTLCVALAPNVDHSDEQVDKMARSVIEDVWLLKRAWGEYCSSACNEAHARRKRRVENLRDAIDQWTSFLHHDAGEGSTGSDRPPPGWRK